MLRGLSLSLFILVFFSIGASAKPAPKVSPDPALMDTKADPCVDYYRYACGTWLDKTKIPNDRPAWDRGFSEIDERNQTLLKGMLEKYAKGSKTPANPYAKSLGQFYGACMKDTQDKSAMPYLKKQLHSVDELKRENLDEKLAWFHRHGISAFFQFGSEQDLKEPQTMIAGVDQGGMGLPTRDYYLDTSEQMQTTREKYQAHLAKMLTLIGENSKEANREAAAILHLETKMAEAALSPVEMRDPSKLYHKASDLKAMAGTFNWTGYFSALGIPKPREYNVGSPRYLKAVDQLLAVADMPTLRAYLKVRLVQAASRALPGPILNEYFDFYYKTLYGMNELPAKWKRCVDATDQFMGFALGRSFVEATFAGSSKKVAQEMIAHLKAEMAALLMKTPWMDGTTKNLAFKKFDKMVSQVGYPDKWRNYDALKIGTSYLENRFEANSFENSYDWAKIDKPVDRSDWGMTPSMVNASFEPQLNRIIFPAGILQSPFFSAKFPASANYAAIGMVIGHEMTHAFDDSGSQFNGDGAVINWWSQASSQEFQKRAQCVAKQFDQFPTVGGGHVNGALTLGEDIGDQGGLKLAYNAWKAGWPEAWKKNENQAREESKKFFLSFAQAWCGKDSEAFEKVRTNADPHPPNRYRVKGALMNFPDFAKTYQCKAGAPMAPKEQCSVW